MEALTSDLELEAETRELQYVNDQVSAAQVLFLPPRPYHTHTRSPLDL